MNENKPELLRYLKSNFDITVFIKESGFRLKLAETTIATACLIYHKFVVQVENPQDFDLNVVGCTALYLAGKAEETICKLRDVINICYNVLNKDKQPLEICEKYWDLRDTIAKSELLLLRQLGFQVTFDKPYKYLLHYLKILEDWVDKISWKQSELPQFCWCTLNDTFHTTLCLDENPSHIAVAIVYFAISCTKLNWSCGGHTTQKEWWKVFCQHLTQEKLFKIVNTILDLYEFDQIKLKT